MRWGRKQKNDKKEFNVCAHQPGPSPGVTPEALGKQSCQLGIASRRWKQGGAAGLLLSDHAIAHWRG